MRVIPYTYCVVRYVHDPAAGESLNIGVILWAPSAAFLAAQFEHHYERLSNTFSNFNGEHYKRSLRQFEDALERLQDEAANNLFVKSELTDDIGSIARSIWPDKGLSFQIGPVLAGVTDDPKRSLTEIFDRMVASQYPRAKGEARSDEDVWIVYHRPLVQTKVSRQLVPKTISTEEFSLKFDHAFKNDLWHALRAVSLDFQRAETIQRKAATWLGNATALQGHSELETLYLLLGRPHLESHQQAYIKAKNLLHKMPIKHELIEEHEAEDFACEIADYMRKHGLIEKETK
jgi:hypothetical protein